MNNFGFASLVAFYALALSPLALAQQGRGHGNGGMMMSCMSQLTPEQKEKVLALHKAADPQLDKLRTTQQNLHRELRDLRLSGAASDKIAAVSKKIEDNRAEMEKFHTDLHAKVQALLPPEQQAACPNHQGRHHGGRR